MDSSLFIFFLLNCQLSKVNEKKWENNESLDINRM